MATPLNMRHNAKCFFESAIWGIAIASLLLATARQSLASEPDFELVYVKSDAKVKKPKPVKPVRKKDALAYVQELDSLRSSLFTTTASEDRYNAYAKRIALIQRRSTQLFGTPVLNQPFVSCVSASSQVSMVWDGFHPLAKGAALTDSNRAAIMVGSAVLFGDYYRQCHDEVADLPD